MQANLALITKVQNLIEYIETQPPTKQLVLAHQSLRAAEFWLQQPDAPPEDAQVA